MALFEPLLGRASGACFRLESHDGAVTGRSALVVDDPSPVGARKHAQRSVLYPRIGVVYGSSGHP